MRVRKAAASDIPELVRLENAAFDTDRLNAQSFRNLIRNEDTASVLVADAGHGRLVGYALLLYRRTTSIARLYSMAVDHAARGTGVGDQLMQAMIEDAIECGSLFLRLEVRPDNAGAIRLYERFGFKPFGRYFQYYEDDTDALRFERPLIVQASRRARRVPYYAQTTDFSCGPAAMMMAMAASDAETSMTRRLELRLWREATTIVMTSGVGGCDPVGMAVALGRRGFETSVHMTSAEPLFLDTVRSAWKREVMTITQQDFRAEAGAMGIPVRIGALVVSRLRQTLEEQSLVIVLISSYRLTHERIPHWVLVYGADERHVFVHDPWIDASERETAISKAGMAIPFDEFERMSVYGKSRLRAAVVIHGRKTGDGKRPARRKGPKRR